MTKREKTMFHIGAAGAILIAIYNGTTNKDILKRLQEHAALVRKDFQTIVKTVTHEEWKAYHDRRSGGMF